jgi:hypothetical protein
MTGPTFEDLFCRHFDCPCSHYEKAAFRELLYGHAKLVAPVIASLRMACFAEDFRFVRDLGEATDLREAMACVADFQVANIASRRVWRTTLKLRVSGRKATRLAQQLF